MSLEFRKREPRGDFGSPEQRGQYREIDGDDFQQRLDGSFPARCRAASMNAVRIYCGERDGEASPRG